LHDNFLGDPQEIRLFTIVCFTDLTLDCPNHTKLVLNYKNTIETDKLDFCS